MRSWVDRIEKILLAVVAIIYILSLIYMGWFIVRQRAVLIPHQDVVDMEDWVYVDQMSGPENIFSPVKVERGGRDEFIFKAHLPKDLPEGSVIAFLNKSEGRDRRQAGRAVEKRRRAHLRRTGKKLVFYNPA